MDILLVLTQSLVVLAAIIVGVRTGGVGIGLWAHRLGHRLTTASLA